MDYNTTLCNNVLRGYYSLEIPIISHFIEFWNEQFIYDENEYYLN